MEFTLTNFEVLIPSFYTQHYTQISSCMYIVWEDVKQNVKHLLEKKMYTNLKQGVKILC